MLQVLGAVGVGTSIFFVIKYLLRTEYVRQRLTAMENFITKMNDYEHEFLGRNHVPNEKCPYLPNPLDDHLKTKLTHAAKSPGVLVLLAPEGTGKSTSIRKVVVDLIKNGVYGGAVYSVTYSTYVKNGTLIEKICKELTDEDVNMNIDELVPSGVHKPTLVVLDHFETAYDVMDGKQLNDMVGHVQSWATSAKNAVPGNEFVVLLVTNHLNTAAHALSANGGEAVHSVIGGEYMKDIKMSEQRVIDAMSYLVHNPTQHELELCINNGTIGYIHCMRDLGTNYERTRDSSRGMKDWESFADLDNIVHKLS